MPKPSKTRGTNQWWRRGVRTLSGEKEGGIQDFVTQAGGEKGQPGLACRPNGELPEEKVLLL